MGMRNRRFATSLGTAVLAAALMLGAAACSDNELEDPIEEEIQDDLEREEQVEDQIEEEVIDG